MVQYRWLGNIGFRKPIRHLLGRSVKKVLSIVFLLVVMTGCASVKYNGAVNVVKMVDYPRIGEVATVYVGDHMVEKGTITEENVLVVNQTIDGVLYNIPKNQYPQLGFDEQNDYYSAVGVMRSGLADPVQALALGKAEHSELCVVTVFGATSCYAGNYERKTRLAERGNSFQQTLIYSGRVGNKINIGYREFSNNTARPAFNNNVEYDLSSSNKIGYKGAVIEVIDANNNSITYKLINNFR